MAPTTEPSPSRSGATLTRATQRFPSGILNDRLDALEAFARQHRASHGRFVGRDEVAFQALDPERAAEPLDGIEQPGRRPQSSIARRLTRRIRPSASHA